MLVKILQMCWSKTNVVPMPMSMKIFITSQPRPSVWDLNYILGNQSKIAAPKPDHDCLSSMWHARDQLEMWNHTALPAFCKF